MGFLAATLCGPSARTHGCPYYACPPRAGSDRAIRAPRSRDGRMSSSLSALVYVAIFGETHSGSGCPSHCVTNSAAAWIAVKRSSPEPVLVNP